MTTITKKNATLSFSKKKGDITLARRPKPVIAIPGLIAIPYGNHAGCAALAIEKNGELLFLGHFCTRTKDDKSLIK